MALLCFFLVGFYLDAYLSIYNYIMWLGFRFQNHLNISLYYFVLEWTCVFHAIEDNRVSTIPPPSVPKLVVFTSKFTSVDGLVWQLTLWPGLSQVVHWGQKHIFYFLLQGQAKGMWLMVGVLIQNIYTVELESIQTPSGSPPTHTLCNRFNLKSIKCTFWGHKLTYYGP